jgi:hypothetical protein
MSPDNDLGVKLDIAALARKPAGFARETGLRGQ